MVAASAVVSRHLQVTPVVPAPGLGRRVVLKLETLQPTGSFKVRGALVAVSNAIGRDPDGVVVAASAGNHGLGVAFAADLLGARAIVVVPETASEAKVAALERFPASLVRHGGSYDEAEAYALALAVEGRHFISPYNDPDVIAGQGTIGLELLDQVPDLSAIVAPVGGGGLVAGLGLAVAERTRRRVIGVGAERSPALRAWVETGKAAPVEVGPTLADGLAGNLEAGSVTVELVRRHVDDLLDATEEEIGQAVRFLATEHGLVAEGSAAAAVAAILSGRLAAGPGATAVVLTGRNISRAALAGVLTSVRQ